MLLSPPSSTGCNPTSWRTETQWTGLRTARTGVVVTVCSTGHTQSSSSPYTTTQSKQPLATGRFTMNRHICTRHWHPSSSLLPSTKPQQNTSPRLHIIRHQCSGERLWGGTGFLCVWSSHVPRSFRICGLSTYPESALASGANRALQCWDFQTSRSHCKALKDFITTVWQT